MGSLRHIFLKHRALAMLVIAAALLVRALLPAGTMIAPAKDRVFVTLCTGMVEAKSVQVAIPLDHDGAQKKAHDGKDSPCAFGALALAATTSPDLSTPPAFTARPVAQPLPAAVSVGRGLAAPPPPQTGPPALI